MDSLMVVVTEIVICLVIAWVLGFLAAWLLFRGVQEEYENEIEELEDNLAYSSACTKNQEREITQQTLKIQEYEKLLKESGKLAEERYEKKDSSEKKNSLSNKSVGNIGQRKKNRAYENEMLKLIEANLDTVNKKR